MIATDEILIPAPLLHQIPIVESAARFKVVRAGRRGGKTVLAEGCAVVGHGPEIGGEPLHKGIVHDLDVVWVARDYTQAGIMWHEFIRPRFKGVPGVRVNEGDRTVTLGGAGTLFVISAENIASARGMGKRLAGMIIEEAAWLDLQTALRDVIMPALMDNEGWLILISTTNAGPDGNQLKETPSYFNRICEEIRAGERSAEWAEFHFTADDNPKISARALASLVAEYPPGSPSLDQEVYAKLLRAGVGLALPELDKAHHLIDRFPVPSHWTQFGGFDWGFNHPWVFGHYAADEDGNVIKVETVWGREQLPAAITQTIIAAVPAVLGKRFIVHAGHDIFDQKGKAIGFQGPTIAETMQGQGLKLIKANRDRVNGLDNLRRYAHVEPAEGDRPQIGPRFSLMDTEGNRRCLTQLQAMQIDPDNMEDALKVDADAAGRGGDDSYDETRYGLMSRPLQAIAPTHEEEREGVSMGYDYDKQRPRVRVTAEEHMSKLIQRARPHVTANRYSVPRRSA